MTPETTTELATVEPPQDLQERAADKVLSAFTVETLCDRVNLVKEAMRRCMEEWREVSGYEGLYEVSNDGRVRRHISSRSLGRGIAGRELAPRFCGKGYPTVRLYRQKSAKNLAVHRLVACAFLGQPPFTKAQVNHRDGVKTNNHASNLEWTTAQGNITHAIAFGLMAINERSSKAKLKNSEVFQIREILAQGVCTTAVANLFNVSKHTIRSLKYNHSWRNLK